MFRAREITHPEVARELLDGFAAELDDVADIERRPALEGRFMSMTLNPSKKAKPAESKPTESKKEQPAATAAPAIEAAAPAIEAEAPAIEAEAPAPEADTPAAETAEAATESR
jgi:hypothetical protein